MDKIAFQPASEIPKNDHKTSWQLITGWFNISSKFICKELLLFTQLFGPGKMPISYPECQIPIKLDTKYAIPAKNISKLLYLLRIIIDKIQKIDENICYEKLHSLVKGTKLASKVI